MRRPVWKVTVIAAIVGMSWINDSFAAGGSFGLCYERLSQLATLHKAQGGKVTVIIDEPSQRKYAVILCYGAKDREMSCTRGGDLLVDGEHNG